MSRKKKFFIISHLCLAFSYFIWLLIQPNVKRVLEQKSETTLFEMVFEKQDLFKDLPESDKELLAQGYTHLPSHQKPILDELKAIFFVQTSPFALAWLFFSILLCLLLLFHIEGAALATWILPTVCLFYALFFFLYPEKPKDSLFPSEAYIHERYMENPHSRQRSDLLRGWHTYLVAEWAKEAPSKEEPIFKEQLEKGLFAFNVARLKWLLEGKGDEIITAGFTSPPSLLRLLFYVSWNFLFAWIVNRSTRLEAASSPS